MIVDCKAPEGNAFVIMGLVMRLFKAAGREKDWPEISKKMMSGDYRNLLKVAEESTGGSIKFKNKPKGTLK